jgi:hypothetical protein
VNYDHNPYGDMAAAYLGHFMGGAAPVSTINRVFEYSEEQIHTQAVERLPHHMVEGMMAYVMKGQPPGGFLLAVLGNDLFGACAAADDTNGSRLRDYAVFLHNYTPGGCHGSDKDVSEWIEIGGLNGMLKTLQRQAKETSEHYDQRDTKEKTDGLCD